MTIDQCIAAITDAANIDDASVVLLKVRDQMGNGMTLTDYTRANRAFFERWGDEHRERIRNRPQMSYGRGNWTGD